MRRRLLLMTLLVVVAFVGCDVGNNDDTRWATTNSVVAIHDINPVVFPDDGTARIERSYALPLEMSRDVGMVTLGFNNWHWCPSDLLIFGYYKGVRGCFEFARENEEGFYVRFDCSAWYGQPCGDTLIIVFADLLDGDGGRCSDIDINVELVPKGAVAATIYDDGGLTEEEWIDILNADDMLTMVNGKMKRRKR